MIAGEKSPDRATSQPLPPPLLPLAPVLYLAWADGCLTDDEVLALRRQARVLEGLGDDARDRLAAWLDPDNPPSEADLRFLLQQVRDGADTGDAADLGALAERLAAPAAGGNAADPALARSVVEALRQSLDLPSGEAARAVTTAMAPTARRPRRPERRRAVEAPDGAGLESGATGQPDPVALNRFIDGDHHALRQEVLAMLAGPAFSPVDTRETHAYRETVLHWCRQLAGRGYGLMAFPVEFGGRGDVGASIAVFETLGYHDLSLLVKYGVQFGLFGGSIYLLGTRSHHETYLRAAGTLDLPGCFAMTETGHGSNVRELETTAEYDVDSGEFVVNTPHTGARKDYIGNAALHGRLAVVFAQLATPAGQHGVHAFLVPIRGDDGTPLPGITIQDCGLKVGLNGVDNGRISFDRVRIPRQNLLDRYGSVSAGGEYTSPIASPTRRFFTMLGTLVAGRISIACASLSAGKSGLTIAIRYTARRRQFGPEGGAEVPVLDYTTMQRALMTRLATAYALDFGLKELVRRFAAAGTESSQEIEMLAAALKAHASAWTVHTLQAAREACGGQGYLAENRIGRLRADTDVFTTFEGANTVLYQLVARGRLSEYREQFGELRVWTIARHLGSRAATRVAELNPIITRRTDPDHLMDPDFHAAALRYREERLLSRLAARLKHRLDNGMDGFDALNECQDHAVELGQSFAERFLLEQFQAAAAAAPPALQPHLRRLCALYALSTMDASAAWYLRVGYIEGGKYQAIRRQVNELCAQVRGSAEALAAGFGIPETLLAAPIALAAAGDVDGQADAT